MRRFSLGQFRGADCDGPVCSGIGSAAALLVLAVFLGSVITRMRRKWAIKGFFGHSVVQLLLGYIALTSLAVGLGFGLLAAFSLI